MKTIFNLRVFDDWQADIIFIILFINWLYMYLFHDLSTNTILSTIPTLISVSLAWSFIRDKLFDNIKSGGKLSAIANIALYIAIIVWVYEFTNAIIY